MRPQIETALDRHPRLFRARRPASASAAFVSPPSAIPASGFGASPVHLPGGLPMGSAKDLDTAKAEFKAAWEALKARTTPERLAAAYKAMNIRGRRLTRVLFADATRDAVGAFGNLQSPFDQPGDRVARQIRVVLPDGVCVALPSTPLCRPADVRLREVAGTLQCSGLGHLRH